MDNEIILKLKAVDKTGKVFSELAKNTEKISKKTSSLNFGNILKGVNYALIAKKATSALIDTISNATSYYANLADSALQANISSAASLDGLAKSLDFLGIKGVSIDNITKSFSKMTQTTGSTDISGFISELQKISKLTTEQERLSEAVRIFGKEAGTSFAVIARGGDAAIQSLANLTEGWHTSTDETINAFAEIDGAWTRICEDLQQTQIDILSDMMSNLIGTNEITEENILLLYEKIKMIFAGMGRAIIAPFKYAFGAIATEFYAFIGVIADGISWVVEFIDEETATKIENWSNRQYDEALEWSEIADSALDTMVKNFHGQWDDKTVANYNIALEKLNKKFAEKAIFDEAVGNKYTEAADKIDTAADSLNSAAQKLDKSIKTTGFIRAGTAESLKIKTISRDWVIGGRVNPSSIQLGETPAGILRSECRKITELEAKILVEIQNKQLIGEI